ncbi:hypothetical protein EDD98_1792 [Streptomyces sp. PanSC19]|nr:hypothetical protein EDD98_1792 [Streptomyces sp. PanSC19]
MSIRSPEPPLLRAVVPPGRRPPAVAGSSSAEAAPTPLRLRPRGGAPVAGCARWAIPPLAPPLWAAPAERCPRRCGCTPPVRCPRPPPLWAVVPLGRNGWAQRTRALPAPEAVGPEPAPQVHPARGAGQGAERGGAAEGRRPVCPPVPPQRDDCPHGRVGAAPQGAGPTRGGTAPASGGPAPDGRTGPGRTGPGRTGPGKGRSGKTGSRGGQVASRTSSASAAASSPAAGAVLNPAPDHPVASTIRLPGRSRPRWGRECGV